MKTFKHFLLTIAALLCSTSILASIIDYDFKVDGICYDITSETDKTVEVTFNDSNDFWFHDYNIETKYEGSISIPEVVTDKGNTYNVTSIGSYAFNGCSGLTSIEIPNSVTSIGYSAFSGCSGLTSIIIPEGVTRIEYNTFDNCTSLTDIELPNSLTHVEICFGGCNNLPVENNIIYADNWAVGVVNKGLPRYVIREGTVGLVNTFQDCYNLVRITLPQSVKYIGESSFRSSGIKEIALPDSVTYIGNSAFIYCRNLETVKMPDGVTIIGWSAFESCESLKNIEWPENLTRIEPYAFSGCKALNYLELPNKVESIACYAFSNCSGLYISKLPQNLRFIEHDAFWNGPILSNDVDLPDSIEQIDSRAFDEQTLNKITIPETLINDRGLYDVSVDTLIIKSPTIISGGIPCRNVKECILLSDTTNLPECYFLNKSTLVSVTLPDSLIRIGDSFFEGCTSLRNIKIPSSVTSIGSYAFYDCLRLNSIKIPESVNSIGENAFNNCSRLLKVLVEWKSDVPTITSDVFANRENATLYIPLIPQHFSLTIFISS